MTTTATPSHPPPPVPNTLAAAAAPVVSSVVPNSGPTTGGTAVVISGSGFTGVTAVRFGSTAAASYTFVSDTQINAVTPPGAVGSARVIVVTSAGSSTQLVNFTYVAVPVPVLSSIAPVSGPLGGGTVVTLTTDKARPFGAVVTDEAGNVAARDTGKTIEGLVALIRARLPAGCGEAP